MEVRGHKSIMAKVCDKGIRTRISFPIKYLGLPLSLTRIKKVDFQPLMDKSSSNLTNWLGSLIAPAGRATLVSLVHTSQAIYYLTALRAPATVLEEFDKKRKRFLWAGTDRIAGGKYKVKRTKVCVHKALGGLGILNLKKIC
jgi:hypothetical protein